MSDIPLLAQAMNVHPCDFFETPITDDEVPFTGVRTGRMLVRILAEQEGLAPEHIQAVVTIVEGLKSARR